MHVKLLFLLYYTNYFCVSTFFLYLCNAKQNLVMKTLIALLALMAVVETSDAASLSDTTTRAPFVRIDYEQLPDLNIPRSGHHTYYAGGELTVMGGHTTGFKPTRTTEYFDGHEWHVVNMTYDHDDALGLQLSSGKVLIGGGHGQPLGIEQTFPTEIYDPTTHEFGGFGCLDVKRVLAAAVELAPDCIVISGNWYHDDAIETFDGKTHYAFVDSATQDRVNPYILQTSADNVMIFSNSDIRGNIFDSIIVDQLTGEPFTVPLFDTWRPYTSFISNQSSTFFIGDADADIYSYLLLATDSVGNYGFIRTQGCQFSLLPTVYPVPMHGIDDAGILWCSDVIADRSIGRAYVMGCDSAARQYIMAVDYAEDSDERGCPITVFYTDPMPQTYFSGAYPVLDPDGNLVVVGGISDSNFEPFAMTLRFLINTPSQSGHTLSWAHVVLCVLALLLIVLVAFVAMRRHRLSGSTATQAEPENVQYEDTADEPTDEPVPANDVVADDATYHEMIEKIEALMQTDRLYLNSELKVQDLAALLGTSVRTVSECVNTCRGCSFSQLINIYRVEYAKQIMHNKPGIKILAVALESGFTNETSFFRTFKQLTDTTPKRWMADDHEGQES